MVIDCESEEARERSVVNIFLIEMHKSRRRLGIGDERCPFRMLLGRGQLSRCGGAFHVQLVRLIKGFD